jgi:hypothetical protein
MITALALVTPSRPIRPVKHPRDRPRAKNKNHTKQKHRQPASEQNHLHIPPPASRNNNNGATVNRTAYTKRSSPIIRTATPKKSRALISLLFTKSPRPEQSTRPTVCRPAAHPSL